MGWTIANRQRCPTLWPRRISTNPTLPSPSGSPHDGLPGRYRTAHLRPRRSRAFSVPASPAHHPTAPGHFRGLFLDLDGTLADTLPGLRASYDRLLASHQVPPTDSGFALLMGTPPMQIPSLLANQLGVTEDPEETLRLFRRMIHSVHRQSRPTPGAAEFVRAVAAAGIPIAVVTSSPGETAKEWLRHTGLDKHITTVVGAEDVHHGKPHRAPYMEAMERLGCPPEYGIAVEDSPSGAKSAVDAGLQTWLRIPGEEELTAAELSNVLLTDGNRPRVAGEIERLDELLPMLLGSPPRSASPWPDLNPQLTSAAKDGIASERLAPSWVLQCEGITPNLPGNIMARVDYLTADTSMVQPRVAPANGWLLSALRSSETTTVGQWVPALWLQAQQVDRTLKEEIRICPTWLRGIVEVEDGVVLARRAPTEGAPDGHWEFAPAAALWTDTPQKGVLDAAEILRDAMAEQLGLAKAVTELAVEPFATVLDPAGPQVSLSFRMRGCGDEASIRSAHDSSPQRRHDTLLLLDPRDLMDFAGSGEPMDEVTATLCRLLAAT